VILRVNALLTVGKVIIGVLQFFHSRRPFLRPYCPIRKKRFNLANPYFIALEYRTVSGGAINEFLVPLIMRSG
jgi:hypothetical protein